MVISDYYDSLDDAGKKEFRNKVLKALDIALPTFYYKLRKGSWRTIEVKIVTKFIPQENTHA